mgnify:CR=1 FL=1
MGEAAHTQTQLLEQLQTAILEYDDTRAEQVTAEILAAGIDPLTVMNDTIEKKICPVKGGKHPDVPPFNHFRQITCPFFREVAV